MDIKFFLLPIALICFILSIVVYKSRSKNVSAFIFFLFILLVSFWTLGLFFYEHPIFVSSIVWIKIVYLLVFFIVPVVFSFGYFFPYPNRFSLKWPLVIYSVLSIPAVWLLFFTDLWVENVILHQWGHETVLGPAYFYPNILWWSLMIILFINLFQKYKKTQGIQKMQLKYFFTGLFIFIFLILVADVMIPLFLGDSRYFWLSPIPSLFFIFCTTYAITRYRFMDIRLLIKKATTHFIFTLLMLAVCTAIVLYSQNILIDEYHFNRIIVTLFGIIIISISFEPLRRISLKIINSILYNSVEKKYFENVETAKFYATKSMAVGKASNSLEEIVHQIICDYLYFISPDQIKLFHYSEETKKLECVFPKKETFSIEIKSDLCYYMNKHAEIVITQEIPYQLENKGLEDRDKLKNIEKLFHKNDIEAAIPIGDKDNMLGLFLLGNKVDNTIYTKEDIELLKAIRHDYTPILFNTIMYKEAIERAGI